MKSNNAGDKKFKTSETTESPPKEEECFRKQAEEDMKHWGYAMGGGGFGIGASAGFGMGMPGGFGMGAPGGSCTEKTYTNYFSNMLETCVKIGKVDEQYKNYTEKMSEENKTELDNIVSTYREILSEFLSPLGAKI